MIPEPGHGKTPLASPSYRELSHAESHFASVVAGYLSSYRDEQKPFAKRVAQHWAAEWCRLQPGLAPAAGDAFRSLLVECR
jgi:hypothetical protein